MLFTCRNSSLVWHVQHNDVLMTALIMLKWHYVSCNNIWSVAVYTWLTNDEYKPLPKQKKPFHLSYIHTTQHPIQRILHKSCSYLAKEKHEHRNSTKQQELHKQSRWINKINTYSKKESNIRIWKKPHCILPNPHYVKINPCMQNLFKNKHGFTKLPQNPCYLLLNHRSIYKGTGWWYKRTIESLRHHGG